MAFRGNEMLAVLLDPRFCKGQPFKALLNAPDAKELFKEYSDKVLIHACVNLKLHTLSKSPPPDQRANTTDATP